MKSHQTLNRGLSGLAHVLATVILAVIAVSAAYMLAVRPWQIRWGATDAEVSRTLPGDELVAQPQNRTTRAITIDAPAASVWPWLVQMGQGRGGLYSYEMLENLIGCDMHNANRVIAELQNTVVGDRVRMYPEGSGPPPYTVAAIVPGRALILGHSTEPGGVPDKVTVETEWAETWAFVLQPADDDDGNSTRLIIRGRSTYTDPVMSAVMSVVEPGYFLMERGMLFGIKERVERTAGIEANYTAADGWGLAFLVAAFAGLLVYLFVGRWSDKLYLFSVGSMVWMAALFFGYPSLFVAVFAVLNVLVIFLFNYVFARFENRSSARSSAWKATS